MIRIAVIGAGRIGQIHALNLAQNPKAELVYVTDVVAESAAQLARKTGATVADVATILDDSSIDAVVIASSTDTHATLVEQSAGARKAIFCEKPLDLDIEAARHCVAVAEECGVTLCIGFNRRHDPTLGSLKTEIDAGHVGNVEVITITSRDPAPPPVDYIKRSGGLFRDMMIHDFDMGRWLLGEEPVEVFASGAALASEAIGAAGDIDTAVAILKTASGRLCQISNSRRCTYGYDQRIEVFGSEGLVRAGNHTSTQLEVANGRGFTTEPALPFFLERYADAYRIQLERFLARLAGESCALPDGNDGIAALRLADAAQASLESGQPVQL